MKQFFSNFCNQLIVCDRFFKECLLSLKLIVDQNAFSSFTPIMSLVSSDGYKNIRNYFDLKKFTTTKKTFWH
jgi:hypothetical protein